MIFCLVKAEKLVPLFEPSIPTRRQTLPIIIEDQQFTRPWHLDQRSGHLAEYGAMHGNSTDALTTKQLADWLGVTEGTIEQARTRGEGPPFVIVVDQVRYLRETVIAWLRARQTLKTQYNKSRPKGSKVINGQVIKPTEPQRIVLKRPE
jgi:hypothetical protein